MGYSARYHVASLAAVFLALGVGILIGTGLQSVVTDATRNLENSLRNEISSAQADASDLRQQLGREREFSQAAYPGLVGGMLSRERIAVLGLGGADKGVLSDVQDLVGQGQPAGGSIQDYAVIREPPDLQALRSALDGKRVAGQPARTVVRGGDVLAAVARRAGRTFASGGAFFRSIRSTLLASESGSHAGIDAVIIARLQPDGMDPAQADATNAFEGGFLDGIRASRIPVVGVETSDSPTSSIDLYSSHSIASVDNVDQESGRVALAYALRGVAGAYGVKSSADSLLPGLVHPRPVGRQPKNGGGGP